MQDHKKGSTFQNVIEANRSPDSCLSVFFFKIYILKKKEKKKREFCSMYLSTYVPDQCNPQAAAGRAVVQHHGGGLPRLDQSLPISAWLLVQERDTFREAKETAPSSFHWQVNQRTN